jgi:hypothetical protein
LLEIADYAEEWLTSAQAMQLADRTTALDDCWYDPHLPDDA